MSKRAYTKANVSNSYKSWTMREDGRIREMYLQGVKATEIGRILGRSTASVNGRLYKLRKDDGGTIRDRMQFELPLPSLELPLPPEAEIKVTAIPTPFKTYVYVGVAVIILIVVLVTGNYFG
jgi:hypothetical protein